MNQRESVFKEPKEHSVNTPHPWKGRPKIIITTRQSRGEGHMISYVPSDDEESISNFNLQVSLG